jgi:lysophospholipid acyltransferase (LPLAT)-like uncharacterized protein
MTPSPATSAGPGTTARSARGRPRVSLGHRALISSAVFVFRLLTRTWRITRIDDAPWRGMRAQGRGYLFAFWHGDMLPLLRAHSGNGEMLMISEHRDGELIARVSARFGFRTTRGSTTRGGSRALLGLIRHLEGGGQGAVSPDGPRGPLHTFQPGILAAARRAAVPVIAIGVAIDRAWRLRSWDRMTIPKPFARIYIAYSTPTTVDSAAHTLDDESARFAGLMESTRTRAQAALDRA